MCLAPRFSSLVLLLASAALRCRLLPSIGANKKDQGDEGDDGGGEKINSEAVFLELVAMRFSAAFALALLDIALVIAKHQFGVGGRQGRVEIVQLIVGAAELHLAFNKAFLAIRVVCILRIDPVLEELAAARVGLPGDLKVQLEDFGLDRLLLHHIRVIF